MEIYNENLSYILHKPKERKNQYELQITFYHSNGKIFEELMLFNENPTEQEITSSINSWANKVLTETIEIE